MADVYLRPLRVEDAKVSYRWRNDSDLWQYTGSHPNKIISEIDEIAWASRAISDSSRRNFAICRTDDDKYIGNIYIVNIKDRAGELGVFIGDKTSHGKGFARQAIELLKKEAKACGISRIDIDVHKDNVPALITYIKCGAKLPESWGGGRILLSLQV